MQGQFMKQTGKRRSQSRADERENTKFRVSLQIIPKYKIEWHLQTIYDQQIAKQSVHLHQLCQKSFSKLFQHWFAQLTSPTHTASYTADVSIWEGFTALDTSDQTQRHIGFFQF